ncbi:MAG: hypothetical protein ISR96_01815 [Nitrospira sp.]|nr:hypothetical protein [Nitrospira sp.]
MKDAKKHKIEFEDLKEEVRARVRIAVESYIKLVDASTDKNKTSDAEEKSDSEAAALISDIIDVYI